MFLQCYVLLVSACLTIATGQATTEYLNASTTGPTTIASEVNTTESTNGTEVTTEIRIPCDDGEWQCEKDGRCIPNNMLCNGLIDCTDASDEYRHTCNNSRPLFGLIFHCSSYWSKYHNDICHPVCHDSPEFCYYAVMAENGVEHQTLCILPNYPVHGWYKLRPDYNATSDPESPKDFWLEYDCAESYVMVQKKRHECKNGTWYNDDDNRYCSDACKLNKNSNFTYACPKDMYDSNECKNYVAINTNVTVSRVPGTAEDETTTTAKNNITLDILCSPDKEFHISTACVDAVDKRQEDFENPTMTKMTNYETEFNKFRANETSDEFQKLVDDFHEFNDKVRKELTDMYEMAEKCDISLDLLLWHLQSKRDQQAAETETETEMEN